MDQGNKRKKERKEIFNFDNLNKLSNVIYSARRKGRCIYGCCTGCTDSVSLSSAKKKTEKLSENRDSRAKPYSIVL